MLRECSREEFEKYKDFAYELATDITKSGYPTYCDGVKTKEMFISSARESFERETEQLLLFELDGKILGMIHYYWLPEDHYLSTSSFQVSTATEQALSEFMAFAKQRFRGYDLFLGFPAENQDAVKFLAEHGFDCIEDDYNNTAFLEKCGNFPENPGLIRIDRENYEKFRVLHEQIEGDMYWNSERILNDLDNWVIFVKEENGRPQGAVYYIDAKDDWFEIFGIDIDGHQKRPKLFRELVMAALQDAKGRGGKVMTFFCEKEEEEIVRECGFVCVGNYLCYKIHLN